jgi:hypothetical protein
MISEFGYLKANATNLSRVLRETLESFFEFFSKWITKFLDE